VISHKVSKFCLDVKFQHNFKCIEYLCKLGAEHLISLTSKFYFSTRNFETFDMLHAFLSLTVAKLSTIQNSQFFTHPVRSFTAVYVK